MATGGTGFECEFVKKPPEAFQSECPVCLQILYEPHQVSCCGYSFCKACIERIKTDNKPCATCNKKDFDTFHDKRLQRSLYGFQVYCSHKQEGCEWKGELGQLYSHLTKCIINCDFHHVGCNVKLPRKDMPAHLNKNLVTHMSLQAASYSKLLASHNRLQASHDTLQANYDTLKDSHTRLQASHKTLKFEYREKVKKLESENEAFKFQLLTTLEENQQFVMRIQKLESQVSKMIANETPRKTQQLTVDMLSVPTNHEMIMNGYGELKSDNDIWHSPPFYSHHGGYKFCLRVDANGNTEAKGTHVSVFTCVMKGEFDDFLEWPFRGKIVIQLVDQKTGKNHYTGTIPYADNTPNSHAGRVTTGEKSEPWGLRQFIAQHAIAPNYLKNDTLCFRVTKFKF